MTASPPSRTVAGRYRLEREVGSGATATVHAAADLKHGRRVAIKILRPEFAATLAGERFLREIAIAAQLQHPHILPLLDSGEADGTLYFVMPFVEGETLRQRLDRQGRLTAAETVRILADLADGLQYAHGRGVIHRDLKPDNVILSGRHSVIMDFGVAKAVSAAADRADQVTTGLALGTPAYMAPEQVMADPATDHRCDLYGLGVVGYELLAGRLPIEGGATQETLRAQLTVTPDPIERIRPDLPPALAEVINRALAKRPADRWQSAAEVLARLDPIATPSGGSTPVDLAPVAPSRRSRLPWLIAAIGISGVALAVWDGARRARLDAIAPVRPTRLTFLGTVVEAAVSPDGQFLAFISREDSTERLAVQDLRGTAVVELATGRRLLAIGWSRDGGEISFRDGSDSARNVLVVPRLGGTPRPIARGSWLRSPDGARMVSHHAPRSDLLVVTPETGDSVHLAVDSTFQWFTGVAWSPASDRVAVSMGNPQARLHGIDIIGLDGRRTVLRRDTTAISILGPAWALDRSALFYLRLHPTGTTDIVRQRLGPDQAPAGEPRTVAAGLEIGYDESRTPALASLSVAGDGRRLFFVQTEQWSNLTRYDVGRGTMDSTPLTIGTAWHEGVALSPDRARLAMFRSTSAGEALVVGRADGTDFQQLFEVQDGYRVAWSPDGSALAFTAILQDGSPAVGIHLLTTGATRTLLRRDSTGVQLGWGPAALVVNGPGNRGLNRIDLESGALAPVVPAAPPRFDFAPIVGDSLIVFSSSGADGAVGIWATTIGGTPRRLLAGPYRPLRFRADGRAVYATTRRLPAAEAAVILEVPLDGGPVRRLAVLPLGYQVEDLSPDGRIAYLNQLRSQSDVWSIEVPPER